MSLKVSCFAGIFSRGTTRKNTADLLLKNILPLFMEFYYLLFSDDEQQLHKTTLFPMQIYLIMANYNCHEASVLLTTAMNVIIFT